jgi:hypothetical protein
VPEFPAVNLLCPDTQEFPESIYRRASYSEKNTGENMKSFKLLASVLFLGMVCVFTVTSASADDHNKKTIMTFSGPVEVPGMVLPAGTYTFVLYDSLSDRNIVEIWNADHSHLLTTVLAINNYRLTSTGKTIVSFDERPADTPEALHAWFYPGDKYGQEFVYPKHRAVELATVNKAPVLATRDDVSADETALKEVPVVAVTPEQTEEPVAAVVQPEPQTVAAAEPPAELPKTASSLPVLMMLGLLCLAIGLALGIFSKSAVSRV